MKKYNMRQNGFSPLLILIIITILAVVGYFGYKSYFPPTPKPEQLITDPTRFSDWKMYENKDAGFTVTYPPDFNSIKSTTANMVSFESTTGINLGFLDFEVVEFSKYKSWIEMIKEDLKNGDANVRHQQISSRDVYFESRQSSGSIFERNIFIINGDSVIHIRVSADENKVPNVIDRVESLANEILSTFKFTK